MRHESQDTPGYGVAYTADLERSVRILREEGCGVLRDSVRQKLQHEIRQIDNRVPTGTKWHEDLL